MAAGIPAASEWRKGDEHWGNASQSSLDDGSSSKSRAWTASRSGSEWRKGGESWGSASQSSLDDVPSTSGASPATRGLKAPKIDVPLGDPAVRDALLDEIGTCTDMFHVDLVARDLRKWSASLGPELAQGICDIWEAVPLARFVAMGVTSLAFVHNFVLCLMHMLYRDRMDYYEFSVLQLCNAICLWCTWRLFYWGDLCSEKQRWHLIMIMAGYVVCLVMDCIVNALPGRASEMALFDATLFCVCSFLCLRGTKYKAVFNFSPCFSWHFWKRTLPWLGEERGQNLGHLLYVLVLYCLCLYLSRCLEPHVTSELERRRKMDRRRLDRKRRERARYTRTTHLEYGARNT